MLNLFFFFFLFFLCFDTVCVCCCFEKNTLVFRYSQAGKVYDYGLQLYPKNDFMRYEYAYLLWLAQKYNDALKELDKCLFNTKKKKKHKHGKDDNKSDDTNEPSDPSAKTVGENVYWLYGRIKCELQDWPVSSTYLSSAMKIKNDDIGYMVDYMLLLINCGMFGGADTFPKAFNYYDHACKSLAFHENSDKSLFQYQYHLANNFSFRFVKQKSSYYTKYVSSKANNHISNPNYNPNHPSAPNGHSNGANKANKVKPVVPFADALALPFASSFTYVYLQCVYGYLLSIIGGEAYEAYVILFSFFFLL